MCVKFWIKITHFSKLRPVNINYVITVFAYNAYLYMQFELTSGTWRYLLNCAKWLLTWTLQTITRVFVVDFLWNYFDLWWKAASFVKMYTVACLVSVMWMYLVFVAGLHACYRLNSLYMSHLFKANIITKTAMNWQIFSF